MSAHMNFSVVGASVPQVTQLPIAHNDAVTESEITVIQIPDGCWEPVDFLAGDESGTPSQLLATLYINSCPMHFEAYLVDDQGEVADPKHHKAISQLKVALRDDEPWKSFQYGNRDYVMIAIPFGISR